MLKRKLTQKGASASSARGFTLVEMAIVLVIIGIIIGAVLKGQQMIDNAKLKRLFNQQREVFAGIYSYYDKYGVFPGDDNNAATRWAGTTSGNNNGQIAAASAAATFACVAGTTTETCQAWRHLRNANLITGSTASAVNPTHAFGAAIGVGYITVQTLAANWIGFNTVPYDACQSLDIQYDDGSALTGSIRGGTDYTSATTGTYAIYFRF